MKGVLAGIAAGVAGAIVWAVIAFFTGFEIGWLAWGIGAIVGAAVAWGTEGSVTMGVVAVVISVIAIVAGKYITVEIALAKELKEVNQFLETQIQNDEYIVTWIADEIVEKYEEEGKTVNLPEDVDFEQVAPEEYYPKEIWTQAQDKWAAMTSDEQEEYRVFVEEQINDDVRLATHAAREESFADSFGIIDVVFFLLAIVTAYKVGSKAEESS